MTNLTQTLELYLMQYGSPALFILLALGILALPIPDETLMVFAGALIAKGKLAVVPTVIAAYAGGMCGISLSYIIGRSVGTLLIEKYGYWLRITPQKFAKIHTWFERVGKWFLLIGYFIAGVRHITGYAAGTTKLSYPQFALFAYLGALTWASIFLALGYYVGDNWTAVLNFIQDQWYNAAAILVILAAIYLVIKIRKNRRKKAQ